MAQIFTNPSVNFFRISTITGTVIKTGSGILVNVAIGLPVTLSGTLTLYDGVDTSGTVINILNLLFSGAPANIQYGCSFTRGLYAVTTGTGNPDVCIMFM